MALLVSAASAQSGAAQSLGQCPSTPAVSASAPPIAVTQPQATPTALEMPIWKTITVGGSKGVNAIRLALETAPCHILIGDDADEILGRPVFPFIKAPVELDLVVLSAFDLGFGDQASRHDVELGASVEASLHDITREPRHWDLTYVLPKLALRCVSITSTSRLVKFYISR
jgi:hypothetical protein